jgi:hypothetical protein
MGALLLLEYALAASVVAVGWSGYAVSLLHDMGVNFPAEYTQAIGKLVIAHASTFNVTDPLVSLNGVTAHLTDGTVVQFLSQGKATITGAFQAALAQYDVVDAAKGGGYALINAVDIAVKADSHALLSEATKVMDPATTHLRDLAAGTQLIVPAGQIVQLPLAAGGASGSHIGGHFAVQSAGGVHHARGHDAAGHRRIRVGHRQQHHRRHQGHGDPRIHRGRRVLRES